MAWDIFLFKIIYSLAGKSRLLDWVGIFIADYLGYFLMLGFILLLLKEKKWQERFYLFAFASLSVILARGIITEIIRFFYYRPRPFLVLTIEPLISPAASGSFPSGNATAFFGLAFVVFYFVSASPDKFNKKWGSGFLALAVLMGIGRIFTGVHWPLDIMGGILVAWGSVFFIKELLRPLRTLTYNHQSNPPAVSKPLAQQ